MNKRIKFCSLIFIAVILMYKLFEENDGTFIALKIDPCFFRNTGIKYTCRAFCIMTYAPLWNSLHHRKHIFRQLSFSPRQKLFLVVLSTLEIKTFSFYVALPFLRKHGLEDNMMMCVNSIKQACKWEFFPVFLSSLFRGVLFFNFFSSSASLFSKGNKSFCDTTQHERSVL